MELFHENLLLADFATRREIRGLGMTDWEGYAVKLAGKFDYQNTYYHEEPRLDVAAPGIAPEFMGKDFIISLEVLEQVTPPVSRAFENVWKILKPGGVFVLTVPYGTQQETLEHFPELNEFSVVERDGSFVLRNKTRTGVVQGVQRSRISRRPRRNAGFANIKVHRAADLVHGIWWAEPRACPMSARKPKA